MRFYRMVLLHSMMLFRRMMFFRGVMLFHSVMFLHSMLLGGRRCGRFSSHRSAGNRHHTSNHRTKYPFH